MLTTTTLTRHTQLPPGPSLPHLEAGLVLQVPQVLQATDLSIPATPGLLILTTAPPGLQVRLAALHFPLRGVELPQPSAPEVHQEVSPGEDISPPEDVSHGQCPALGGQAPTPAPPSSHRPQSSSPQWRLSPILTPS